MTSFVRLGLDVKFWLIVGAAFFSALTMGSAQAQVSPLAERLEVVAGAPALLAYAPGASDRPLIVFIPGAGHLGRIAYGAAGSDPKDFLAYWLNQEGYGFLAVSYPLGNSVFTSQAPAFTISDWGRQAAEATRSVVHDGSFSGHVILVGWSMGGRILEAYVAAARRLDLTVDLYVSLASTPEEERHPPTAPVQMVPSGYARLVGVSGAFERQLAYENQLNGHVIISPQAYRQDYTGDTPVGLTGWGLKYTSAGFISDQDDKPKALDPTELAHLPPIAAVHGDSPLDPVHALNDASIWGARLTAILTARLRAIGPLDRLPARRWRNALSAINSAPSTFSAEVHGDHFFFVGASGAKQVAKMIGAMDSKAQDLNQLFPAPQEHP